MRPTCTVTLKAVKLFPTKSSARIQYILLKGTVSIIIKVFIISYNYVISTILLLYCLCGDQENIYSL